MSPLDSDIPAPTADTINPWTPYVPTLERTAGQPPPIAANGGLSYMSFDQDGDAGTTTALTVLLCHCGAAAQRRDGLLTDGLTEVMSLWNDGGALVA